MKLNNRNYSLSKFSQIEVPNQDVSSKRMKSSYIRDKFTSQSPFGGESFEISRLKKKKS